MNDMTRHGLPMSFDEPLENGAIPEPLPPEFSDDWLADALSAKHKDELRYVAKWGRWIAWTGTRWQQEEYTDAVERARKICRETALLIESEKDSIRRRLTSAATVAGVERLARGDFRHRATIEQWDAEHMLLNTPTGTVDLTIGKLLPHSREQYLTKQTAVGPGGQCPLFRKFLHRVTDGNKDLESFLQRLAGYSLTGSTKEQALSFAYGLGGNGKGVFVHTLSRIMGDYHKTAAPSVVTASKNDSHPTDLASLHGARLVTAIETENNRSWAEARIKALTGGDPIPCRRMHQDFWEYVPTFKLLVVSNHKPKIGSVDAAIRRRIHLIPFIVQITAAEKDLDLEQKLLPEFPGILQWMIEGCLEWQRIGLCPPAVVQEATEEYFEAEDIIGRWIAECCVVGRQFTAGSTPLYRNYATWCDNMREDRVSQTAWGETLGSKFKKDRDTNTGRSIYKGIALKADVGCE